MAMEEVRIVPGFNTQLTPTLNKAGVSGGQFIRWRDGVPEKMGGWQQYLSLAMGSTPRELLAWLDINGNARLAIGSTASLKVALITSAAVLPATATITDITPQTTTTNTAPNFSTVNGSNVVTIVDSNISNPTTNNAVYISTPVSIGGIVLFGIYPINSVLSPTSYTILAAQNATATVNNAGAVPSFATTNGSSTVTVTLNNHGLVQNQNTAFLVSTTVGGLTIFGTYQVQAPVTTNAFAINVNGLATSSTSGSENGGNVRTVYYIALGPQSPFSGWGSGTYGSGGWGTGTAQPAGAGTPITAVDWTLINFGEVLIACPAGGGIYQWGPESAFQNAQLISQAPVIADGIMLAQPQQIVLAWGVADSTGIQNPLRMVWSDAGNFLNWTALITNFAGGFTIPRGSKIMRCLQAPNQIAVWTDVAFWSGQYVNQPDVFDFTEVMTGCGLIGRKAAGVLGVTTYWMSQKQFFYMPAGGVPQVLPCKVRDFIFQNLDLNNVSKIRCFANSEFNEIGWFFPSKSGGLGENDSYVKFNAVEGEWDTGPLGRSAWIDQSVLGPPIAAGAASQVIFQHEQGYDANGAAINAVLITGAFRLGPGEEFQMVEYVIPDFKYGVQGGAQTATLLFTLTGEAFPNDPTPNVQGPFSTNSQTQFFEPRLRSRDMILRIESQDLGSFWRGGLVRYRSAPDGRNP